LLRILGPGNKTFKFKKRENGDKKAIDIHEEN
jgi:hypothetical protein